MIVYDTEIIRPPIIDKKRQNWEKYEYAEGWKDYMGMGISVLALFDYMTGKYLEFHDFPNDSEKVNDIFESVDIIVGFNIKKFDNPLLRAHGINARDDRSYDELEQLWLAHGITGEFNFRTHGGFSLDKVLEVNFENLRKGMNGKEAPFLWQDGKKQEVIEYCRDGDVYQERMVLNKIFNDGGLISPKTGQFVKMPLP